MAAKSKLSLIILILSVLVLYSGLAVAKQDPELKECMHQCRVQQKYDEEEKEECERKCEDYHKEKKERESLEYKREEEEEKDNPYVFEDEHFSTEIKTEQGRVDLLTKFSDKSKLLHGIENYRVALLVANPNAFVVPNHFDADAVFVVTQGRGTITLVHEDKRENFNIESGDIIRVHAGTPIYLINTDDKEKLYIVKFLQPVNLPGHYQVFFDAGGEKPESFLTTFSTEILEAALKTSRDKLESLFERQDQGPFLKASKQQIESMRSHKQGGGGIWPFEGVSKGPFNLFSERWLSQANEYGQLFEVDGDKQRQLKDPDIGVSYANITKGCMSAPLYNSRATKIAIVVAGKGYFEMACPHVSSQQSQDSRSSRRKKSGPSYRRISSPLRPHTVFVVPAGHAFTTVASRNKNLEILCFEVNIQDNARYPLAGKGNIVLKFEKEAKELAFKTKEEEVDKIFGNQDGQFFFPGPRQQQGRAYE